MDNNLIVSEFLNLTNSKGTRRLYEFELNSFLEIIKDKKVNSFTIQDILLYKFAIQKYSLKNGEIRDTSSSTIARKLSIIKNFLRFLYRRKYLDKDLFSEIDLPKVHQKHPDVLTEKEANALLRSPDRRTKRGLRDYLILKIFLLTGCRLQELIDINWEDFQRKYNFLTLTLRGKGNKERVVKIPKDLEAELKEYKGKNEFKHKEPLFLTTSVRGLKPGRISRIAIRNMLNKYSRIALIDKNITPHSLRHTCFSLEVANGADIFRIMEQAGHTSLLVTQRYIRLFNTLENNGVDYNPLVKTKEVF